MYNYSIQVGPARKEWMGVSSIPIIAGKRQSGAGAPSANHRRAQISNDIK